jgi:hypothetical protein
MDGYLAKPLDMSVLREELIKHASCRELLFALPILGQ